MFLPLVDLLRCVNVHAESWLVASIDRAVERDIVEGMLGCPICSAEYPIRDGVVHFGNAMRPAFTAPNEEDVVRLAAALDLTDARMTAVLHGAWGAHAPVLQGISPVQLLLVNPPEGVRSGDGVSIVVAPVAPLAHSSADAVAASDTASEAMIDSLCNSLRGGRRMLGPVALAVPPNLMELARDDEIWVAQLEQGASPSAPIPIMRRSGST